MHFTYSNPLFAISILLAIIALSLFYYGKSKPALAVLFLSGLCLRFFMASLDPFLHEWDERFHALVARNMMDNPFKPYLRPPLIPYDYKPWCCNYIWLHKQPLFMWQMALSMKIGGVSEFAMRIPSVLMGGIMIPLTYRIAEILSNKRTAFIAASLMCFSFFHLTMTSGIQGMEHNDIAFGFYVLASFWTYAEYSQKNKLQWALLTGLFSGLAILNKWLPGLIVFSGWGITLVRQLGKQGSRKFIFDYAIATAICIATFLPWQLYILYTFPEEARYEFSLNREHFFNIVEGHGGTPLFYLEIFHHYFGMYIWPLVFVGSGLVFILKKYRNNITIAFFLFFYIAFIFYSFIVQTKVHGFLLFVQPIGLIFIAITINEILNIKWIPKFTLFVILPLICFLIFNYFEISGLYHPDNWDRQKRIHNTEIYKNLKNHLPKDVKVVMNARAFEDIEVMFYNKNIVAYHYCLSEKETKLLKKQHLRIAIFKESDKYPVPDYIKNDPDIFIIQDELWH